MIEAGQKVFNRWIPPFLLFLVLAVGWIFVRPSASPASKKRPPAQPAKAQAEPPLDGSTQPAADLVQRLDLAALLNAPGRTAQQDVELLQGILHVWQTNFLRDGNPVGDNAEITAALAGKNPLRVAFIAPDHPAINQQGELCDRWGSPYFFHQISQAKMEIRSAGPDRRLYTGDDVVSEP